MKKIILCLFFCFLLIHPAHHCMAQEKDSKVKFYQPDSPSKYLLGSTGLLFSAAVVSVGFLALMPESFTGWSDDDISNFGKNYIKKVNLGPAIDSDEWYLNYLAHPYVGAIYYMQPRSAGFSWAESAFFAFLMSTFFWEFGIEAMAEIPSWQDLIITPAIGSIIGEGFYRASRYIKSNNDRLFNSRFLGKTALFLMDPIGFFMKDLGVARAMGVKDQNVATTLLPQKGGLVASLRITW